MLSLTEDNNIKIAISDSDDIVWRPQNNSTISYNSAIYGSGSEDQITNNKTQNDTDGFMVSKIELPTEGSFYSNSIRADDIYELEEKIKDGILYHEDESAIKFIGKLHGRLKPTINKLNNLDKEYKLGKKKERKYATILILTMIIFLVILLWLMYLGGII